MTVSRRGGSHARRRPALAPHAARRRDPAGAAGAAFRPEPVAPEAHTWLRAIGRLPDDQNLHCAVLAYASDMTLLDIACYPHGVSWIDARMEQASLDHAMWFHRPFRCDEWLLYAQAVPVQAVGRAFARASVFTRAGALVASVAQEGLSRFREGE